MRMIDRPMLCSRSWTKILVIGNTGLSLGLTFLINMAATQGISNNKYKIIIIGAGMAGLSAANHLVKNGVTNFKILEARNRIGGRIVATDTGIHNVELGANWIHGVLGNPMYELAMANGLIDIVHVPKPHTIVAAMEDGKQIPFPVLQEIYEAYICFLRRCEEYFLCHYLPPEGIQSVGEHIGLEATLYLDRIEDSDDRHLRQLIFQCLLKRETCITGCHSMEEIDLLELGSYTELQGGNIVLPSGYSSILEPVSRHIPPENICFLQPVSSIRWRYADEQMIANLISPIEDSGIASSDPGNESDDSDRTVTEFPVKVVSSQDDSTEKEVLSTVKEDKDEKNSALAESDEMCNKTARAKMKSAVREISLDETLGKPEIWDKTNIPNVEIVCENGSKFYADHVICTIPLGVLKENASTLFSPPLPQYKLDSIEKLLFGTVNKILLEYDRPFLNPNISEVMLLWDSNDDTSSSGSKESLQDTWFRKIYSFSKITETLLLGWISGKEAEFMETLPHEQVSEKCTEILRKFLNDPFVPKPKLCMCTSWHTQTYTRGSYSAMAVGASQIDIEHLAQPLYANPRQNKPPLLFAGEHTHSSFYSTVHGAYLTGRSVAQTLLRPDSPQEIVLDCEGTSDLSSWIQGIALED